MEPLSCYLGLILLSAFRFSEGLLVRGFGQRRGDLLGEDVFMLFDMPKRDPVSSTTSSMLSSLTSSTRSLTVSTGMHRSIMSKFTETPSNYTANNETTTNNLNNTLHIEAKGKYPPKRLNIHGNQSFIVNGYKYIYPVVFGICLGTTLLFFLILSIQFRRSTPMGRATFVILIAIATADTLTMGSSFNEISLLYKTTSENSGFLPFRSCKTMYILERFRQCPMHFLYG